MAGKTTFLGLIAGFALLLMAAAAPAPALAGGCNSCAPPPCCVPPPSPPPTQTPCCTPGHNVNVPSVNVFVSGAVVVNANVQARANAGAQAQGAVFVGGGGGGYYQGPSANGLINGLNVEGKRRIAYEAERSMYKKVVMQAFCFDDREVPHPASQVTPDRDIDDAYDGELYRCMAGTHMQWTVVEWREKISFEGGKSMTCAKGEALYHFRGAGGASGGRDAQAGGGHGARLECRPQLPARDCNERSLLRRFGAGIKILTIMITEKYTAYREESTSTSGGMAMSLDGGVGGIAY